MVSIPARLAVSSMFCFGFCFGLMTCVQGSREVEIVWRKERFSLTLVCCFHGILVLDIADDDLDALLFQSV
jgi:hypothetical protein